MRIVACYKIVPNDQEISVKGDRTLDTSKAQLAISRYDLEAVEAAVQFKGAEDEVCALTVAAEAVDNTKLRKAILSRGPQALYAVHDEKAEEADSLKTAQTLKAAIEKIGDVELVLCGEGSEDMYCQQVGPMLGALLGWTNVNAVSKISRSEKRRGAISKFFFEDRVAPVTPAELEAAHHHEPHAEVEASEVDDAPASIEKH